MFLLKPIPALQSWLKYYAKRLNMHTFLKNISLAIVVSLIQMLDVYYVFYIFGHGLKETLYYCTLNHIMNDLTQMSCLHLHGNFICEQTDSVGIWRLPCLMVTQATAYHLLNVTAPIMLQEKNTE